MRDILKTKVVSLSFKLSNDRGIWVAWTLILSEV